MKKLYILICILVIFSVPACNYKGPEFKTRINYVHDASTISFDPNPPFYRFDGVDAPGLDEPGGVEGKKWIVDNYGGKSVYCYVNQERGDDNGYGYDRSNGVYYVTCYGPNGENISEGIIAAGLARDCPRYSKGRYKKYETARSRSRPMKPYCR